ncbi:MAG: NRDE family protein [Phycisphaerales bacterium]|nr:NRDE family protein [Phycisphaerales bacterium]
MCTVTIISLPGGGRRLVSNRDELRARPDAIPPEAQVIDGVRVLAPRDPLGGGTWVAGNDRGLAMTLLNLNERPRAGMPPGRISRGGIVRHASGANTAHEAMAAAAELDLDGMLPFRFVVVQGDIVLEGRWDQRRFDVLEHTLECGVEGAPGTACFTSSGLGDALVTPRLALWRQWSETQPVTVALQDKFHGHRWSDRLSISVHMERTDARTVSTTAVNVVPNDGVEMHYWADDVRTACRLALRPTAAVSVPPTEATV